MENVAKIKSDLHEAFCANVRARRKELMLTQEQVASRMGVKQGTYGDIESMRRLPRIDIIERVCDALECSASELFACETIHS